MSSVPSPEMPISESVDGRPISAMNASSASIPAAASSSALLPAASIPQTSVAKRANFSGAPAIMWRYIVGWITARPKPWLQSV